MEHIWILYKTDIDFQDEKSYYCKNCNMKIFKWHSSDQLENLKTHIATDDINFEYDDYSCDEYLIKNLIE